MVRLVATTNEVQWGAPTCKGSYIDEFCDRRPVAITQLQPCNCQNHLSWHLQPLTVRTAGRGPWIRDARPLDVDGTEKFFVDDASLTG